MVQKKFNRFSLKYLLAIVSVSMLISVGAAEKQLKQSELKTEDERMESRDGKKSLMSKELEITLNKVFQDAHKNDYEFVTLEQLLLVLLENPSAAEVLRSSGLEFGSLRSGLVELIEKNTPKLESASSLEVKPTQQFQRVLQRTVFHGASAGKKKVVGSHVLIAIYGEQDSHAVELLHAHDITRSVVLSQMR